MKYLILLLVLFSCKKEITQPSQPIHKRLLYKWDYMINGSNQIYQGKGCYYPNEMDSVQTNTGAFNVKVLGSC